MTAQRHICKATSGGALSGAIAPSKSGRNPILNPFLNPQPQTDERVNWATIGIMGRSILVILVKADFRAGTSRFKGYSEAIAH